jgi:uncharacterized protein YbjT (DUF2867 family)
MGKVLVTGGTGTLGREVVRRLVDAGREVRVLSRHPRPAPRYESVAVDLVDGTGLNAALSGVDTVVHCASRRHDVVAARNLIVAAERAGVGHLVYISIVGVDRVPLGYYRGKLEVERLIEQATLGWTILRSTQFHPLIARMPSMQRRSPVILALGGVSFQPIDVGEVAARLVELALGAPAGRVPDMGGPQIRTATDLTRAYLRATGRRRLVVPIRLPGAVFRGYRQGGHLAPDHAVGRTTFDEFLHR